MDSTLSSSEWEGKFLAEILDLVRKNDKYRAETLNLQASENNPRAIASLREIYSITLGDIFQNMSTRQVKYLRDAIALGLFDSPPKGKG